MDFYKGKLEGKEVVVVRSGIGKGQCSYVYPDSGRYIWCNRCGKIQE